MISLLELTEYLDDAPPLNMDSTHKVGSRHDLIGEICVRVIQHHNMFALIFASGAVMGMYHHQDCCETVEIEEIAGDIEDLLFTPLNVFDIRTQKDDKPTYDDSGTWTFYTLRTIKGTVDIRWYGSSNGYYSEEVTLDVRLPRYPHSAHESAALIKEAIDA